jgi:flagellar biosynthesis/type III secretory pathway protein FliH
MNMKSSRNLNPLGKTPQAWIPVELSQSNMGINMKPAEKGDGKPVALFDIPSGPVGGNCTLPGVIKASRNVVLSEWLPGEFTSFPKTDTVNKPDWQASIKYPIPARPWDAAQELISDARTEAEQILRNAQQTAKGIQEQAYQDGWNSAMGEIKDRMVAATSLIQELSNWRDEMMSQSEQMILEIIRSIAQKMFGTGFELDRETLQVTFNRVLENARSLGNLRVYVNPEDASNLGPYWREFQESITSHTIEIIPSSSIARGGCYVNGQWGSADGRIETQVKAILDTFDNETSVSEN